jgi:hypothetical protein
MKEIFKKESQDFMVIQQYNKPIIISHNVFKKRIRYYIQVVKLHIDYRVDIYTALGRQRAIYALI